VNSTFDIYRVKVIEGHGIKAKNHTIYI